MSEFPDLVVYLDKYGKVLVARSSHRGDTYDSDHHIYVHESIIASQAQRIKELEDLLHAVIVKHAILDERIAKMVAVAKEAHQGQYDDMPWLLNQIITIGEGNA